MHFNQRVHAKRLRASRELVQGVRFKYRAYQENGICTRAASLVNLIFIDQEILPQERRGIGKRFANDREIG